MHVMEEISTVAVGTDGSATAAEAVRVATETAKRFDARLVLISASADGSKPATTEVQWASNPASRVHEILARTQEDVRKAGLECETRVEDGDPAKVIVRLAEECGADLLVIGNKGMKRRVLGSVPNAVSHAAPCSVLVVKTT
jgi:nucleotide-binding universal stress UspA family protein